MSKCELLYVKGMNSSDTDTVEEDIWDDKKLNDAYDKALKMANIEVAKRIAMSTNTQEKKDDHSKKKRERPTSKATSSKKCIEWKSGMPCRAVYEQDGLEYEAFLLSVIDDNECVVRFLGYENTEIVSINSLKPSLGSEERTRQIEQALDEQGDDASDSQTACDPMEFSDREQSVKSAVRMSPKKKPSKNNKKRSGQCNGFDLPEMPTMPSMSMIKNLGSMDMPIPPPPPMHFMNQDKMDTEDQAISSMLLSWYMSGYYTGLYQGMKRAKANRRNV